MGKSSKKKGGADNNKKKAVGGKQHEQKITIVGNEIPLYRKIQPETFKSLVDELDPVLRFNAGQTWLSVDDDSFYKPSRDELGELILEKLNIAGYGVIAECPLCFAPAYAKCGGCNSVFYCSKECQTKSWKLCHKKACKRNPYFYQFSFDINQFKALPEDAYEGHEFILIKPTEKLSSLADICDVCLESADDVFEKVPDFGHDQIQPGWVINNCNHPISRAVRKHFGWTSPEQGVSALEGYRHSEDHFVSMLMYDDRFQMQKDMADSYYGGALFAATRENTPMRGNLLIFKLFIKNKMRVKRDFSNVSLFISQSDDDDLKFEYVSSSKGVCIVVTFYLVYNN